MIAIGFPTKYEAEDYLKSIGGEQLDLINGVPSFHTRLEETEIVVAILGMGAKVAAQRTQALFERFSIETFILAGFAGALTPALKRGQVLIAQGCTSEETMSDIKFLSGFDIARLLTVEKLAETAEEKSRLASEKGCQFVDMETTGILPVVKQNGAEFIAVRSISDLADEDLPADVLTHSYNLEKAKETPIRLIFYLATHPWRIGAFKKFLKPLPQAREKLTHFLVELIQYLA